MKKLIVIFLFAVYVCSNGVVSAKESEQPTLKLSASELRTMQERTFETADTFKVMKSILNVLQDEYYFVEQTDSKIGYILAAKEFDTYDPYIDIKETFGCKKLMTGIKRYSVARTEGNYTVTSAGSKTLVRVRARKKILNMYDVEIKVADLVDKTFYDNFFDKLQVELDSYKSPEEASLQQNKEQTSLSTESTFEQIKKTQTANIKPKKRHK
ncbi:MAG: hypothetical protein PHV37_00150 [Candidatus Gastranaerophilales bacterium]|nr:hypothetical protein [Candidatus Gastranaerophilales bacterium]